MRGGGGKTPDGEGTIRSRERGRKAKTARAPPPRRSTLSFAPASAIVFSAINASLRPAGLSLCSFESRKLTFAHAVRENRAVFDHVADFGGIPELKVQCPRSFIKADDMKRWERPSGHGHGLEGFNVAVQKHVIG